MLAAELVSAWEILCFVPVHGVSNGKSSILTQHKR